jgi:capsular polysaccharide biosynthesis protein
MSSVLREDYLTPGDAPTGRRRVAPLPAHADESRPPRRRRLSPFGLALLLALPVLAGSAAAVGTAQLADPVYAARSEIIFDLRALDWSATDRFLATQTVLAQTRGTLAPVAEALSIPVGELDSRLSAAMVGQSTVLRLEYRDRSRQRAVDVLGAVTDRYLATLRDLGRGPGGGSHRLLTPAYALDAPVEPQPFRAAALGAAVGLAIAIAGALLLRRPAEP